MYLRPSWSSTVGKENKVRSHFIDSSSRLRNDIEYFLSMNTIPVAPEKRDRIYFNFVASLLTRLHNIIMSSRKRRCDICKVPPKLIPKKDSTDFSWFISLILRLSTTKRNSIRARGNPWLRPLLGRKKWKECPFTKTTNEIDWMHDIIQLTMCNLYDHGRQILRYRHGYDTCYTPSNDQIA